MLATEPVSPECLYYLWCVVMSFNTKLKFHVTEQEWAGLANSRQQLEQSLSMSLPESAGCLDEKTELEHKCQMIQQQATEISHLRAQVRYLQAQLVNATRPTKTPEPDVKPAPSRPPAESTILSHVANWAELTPAWQNGDLGIRPWQAQPSRSQRRVQVELPNFSRR